MNYSGLLNDIVDKINTLNPAPPTAQVLKVSIVAPNSDRYKLGYKIPYIEVAYLGANHDKPIFRGTTDQHKNLDLAVEISCSDMSLILDTLHSIEHILIGYRPKAQPNFLLEPISLVSDEILRDAEKSLFIASLKFKAKFIISQQPVTNPVVTQVNYNNI